jgi:hypothetical protein
MNWKRTLGGVALLAGGWLLWRWWRDRSGGTPATAAAIPGGGSIGQVGATIREDSTPEVVNAVLAYSTAAQQQATCWTADGANDGKYFFRQPSTGIRVAVPVERAPFDAPQNICGRSN